MAISLGRLIRLLEIEPQDNRVTFDFGSFVPSGISSYRGFYDQLAIGFKEYEDLTVAELIKVLRSANGKTFMGYKGGEYTMDLETPVWAANYGESNQTAVEGLCDCSWKTVIATKFEDN